MVPSVPAGRGSWPPAPEVVAVAAGHEPLRLDHRGGRREIARHRRGRVRVAAERDRFASGLVPPPDDLRPQRHDLVDLHRAGIGVPRPLRVDVVVRWQHALDDRAARRALASLRVADGRSLVTAPTTSGPATAGAGDASPPPVRSPTTPRSSTAARPDHPAAVVSGTSPGRPRILASPQATRKSSWVLLMTRCRRRTPVTSRLSLAGFPSPAVAVYALRPSRKTSKVDLASAGAASVTPSVASSRR